ncbi:MAG: 5'-3' exonuclease [Lachnospiraceae bacterium]|nr:5'-3' exonuclease [Lachnospiraceae bacterium]
MEKLLIVDGTNLLFQMFFGMPSKIVNKDGKPIHGLLGFIGAFIKIIKITSPTHIVILFDGEHENSRTELLADYKANRMDYTTVPEENNPFSQLKDIYDALDFLAVKHTEITELEADDVISSYALKYGKDMEIIISSFDSDFFQLINERVSILRYRGSNTILCETAYIQDKYGILPYQYADFKALTGDASDNIKGAEKIGPKTAAALMNQFGNLHEIIINADKISKPSIQESILRNTDRLHNNYKLIKLDDKATIPFDISELIYSYSGITTNEILTGINLK